MTSSSRNSKLFLRRVFNSAAFSFAFGFFPRWLRASDDDSGVPTLGGKQLWADEVFFHDWHIQRNVFTGHYRLLDGSQHRHASGTLDQCRARLEEIRRERNLPPMAGPAVIVMHGLMRSSAAMAQMSRMLREQGKYTVFNVGYPTTRGTVEEHAARLRGIIAGLDGVTELNFVAHSLGNIVIRCYLGEGKPDPRIKRMVMLGPPNNGARLAEMLTRTGVFELVAGKAGSQLAKGWTELTPKLATPECEFAIIAGGRGDAKGYNPVLKGDNDLIVDVESTRLAGAADFAVLPVIHATMMDDPQVHEYTLRFLQQGHFVSAAARDSIPRPKAQ